MVQCIMLYGDEMWPLKDKLNKRNQNETLNNMGRKGVALSETRKVENRVRWYEHAEQVREKLSGNGHHKEKEEKYK